MLTVARRVTNLLVTTIGILLLQRTSIANSTTKAGDMNKISSKNQFINLYGRLESTLLLKTSHFLLSRYLGYDVSDALDENILAYNERSRSAVVKFVNIHQFPMPIASIQAIATRNCVKVEYDTFLSETVSEVIHFDEGQKITTIETSPPIEQSQLIQRLHHCGGGDSIASINALASVRVLHLAMQFLHADVHQQVEEQGRLLADDAQAFGGKDKQTILDLQRRGVLAGTTYAVPFPVQVNIENPAEPCVVLDFFAYNNQGHNSNQTVDQEEKEQEEYRERDGFRSNRIGTRRSRGTDIMYVDLSQDKIVRIDTLRHTLTQPPWVIQHFQQPST